MESSARRTRGSGTVYQRKDGRWVATYRRRTDWDRVNKSFVSANREDAESRLLAWIADNGVTPPPAGVRSGNRATYMTAARSLGSHAEGEWRAVRDASDACHYCRRSFDGGVVAKDHRTPVSRGGSDGMGNIAACCMDCNAAKGAMTEAEFIEWAASVGFFTGPRRRIDRVVNGHRRLIPTLMSTGGRGWCPSCGRGKFSINSDGCVHGHRAPDGQRCKGGMADA